MVSARGPDDLLGSLAATAAEAVAAVVPPGARCALVGFPRHENYGDSAIWLGSRAVLRDVGLDVRHVCEWRTYRPDAIRAAVGAGDSVIALAGGMVSDLWGYSQRTRERVLEDFRGAQVVQLPCSVYFRSAESVDRFRRLMQSHGAVTLMARDGATAESVRGALGAPSVLAPDLAVSIGALPRPAPPVHDVVWLLRSDKTAQVRRPALGVDAVDWTSVPAGPSYSPAPLVAAVVDRCIPTRMRSRSPRLARMAARTYDFRAAERVRRACTVLSRGRVVVTDRLHGHLLALAMGVPHVLMDNAVGKVRAFYETWTRPSELVRWASSVEEAHDLSRALV